MMKRSKKIVLTIFTLICVFSKINNVLGAECEETTVISTGCFTCNNGSSTYYEYKEKGDKVCTFCIGGTADQHNISKAACEAKNGSTVPFVPNGKGFSISEATASEKDLTVPSRMTNSETGACEDYLVWKNSSQALFGDGTNYVSYGARSNCIDNQEQEFVAFCMDPTLTGPNGSGVSYTIDQYLDPTQSGFAAGVVYIYDWYKSQPKGVLTECIADTAMRYLEYDRSVGNNIEYYTTGRYSSHANGFINRTKGGTCGTQALALYEQAKAASPSSLGSYAATEIKLEGDVATTEDGMVNGVLTIVANGQIVGTPKVTCPAGVSCTVSGNSIYVSGGPLSCKNKSKNQVKVTLEYASSEDVRNVLLVRAKRYNRWQRFILFQTGGNVTATASYPLNPSNCTDCKTSVDLTCGPSAYGNLKSLKEGIKDGAETDWAECIYDNVDSKGNSYDVLSNRYCRVSCAEEWEFSLPGSMITTSGRYFRLKAQIGATRTCRVVGDGSGDGKVTAINYERNDNGVKGSGAFDYDYDTAAKEMVKQYNIYVKEKAIVELYEANSFTKKQGTPASSTVSCRQDPYSPAKCSLTSISTISSGTFDPDYYDSKYLGEAKFDEYTYHDNDNTITSISKTEGETYNGNRVSPLNSVAAPTGCACDPADGIGGDPSQTPEKVKEEHERARDEALNAYKKQLSLMKEYKEQYEDCIEFNNEFIFEPGLKFTYQESYMDIILQHQNKNYLIDANQVEDQRSASLTFYSNYSNNALSGSSGEPVKYQYIEENGKTGQYNLKKAYYAESKVVFDKNETDFQSGVYFYTINPSGLVTTDESVPNATPLGYVYPVSLDTPQGTYPYTLEFTSVGMYNDSDKLGRILGNGSTSQLSGELSDYVCSYTTCDPTIDSVDPDMCIVNETSTGDLVYHGLDGRVVDLATFNNECSNKTVCPAGPGRVCEWYQDENGNDVYCDKSGNCTNNPSSYLEQCSKDCAGYSLVSYTNVNSAKVENSGRLQFLPKVVSLNNLFSSGDQSAKALNWQTDKAQAARNQIETDGESIYGKEPEYEFDLSPAAMAEIRNYNKQQENSGSGYADFNLTCDKYGIDCKSNFLDNLDEYKVDVITKNTTFTHDDKGYSYR